MTCVVYLSLNLLTIKNFKPWDKVAVSDKFYTCFIYTV